MVYVNQIILNYIALFNNAEFKTINFVSHQKKLYEISVYSIVRFQVSLMHYMKSFQIIFFQYSLFLSNDTERHKKTQFILFTIFLRNFSLVSYNFVSFRLYFIRQVLVVYFSISSMQPLFSSTYSNLIIFCYLILQDIFCNKVHLLSILYFVIFFL